VEWFRNELGISVSRSAIGQKLAPYYDRFVHSKLVTSINRQSIEAGSGNTLRSLRRTHWRRHRLAASHLPP
jgi:hypothetical protein